MHRLSLPALPFHLCFAWKNKEGIRESYVCAFLNLCHLLRWLSGCGVWLESKVTVAGLNPGYGRRVLMEMKCKTLMYCAMSVHVTEAQVVETSLEPSAMPPLIAHV